MNIDIKEIEEINKYLISQKEAIHMVLQSIVELKKSIEQNQLIEADLKGVGTGNLNTILDSRIRENFPQIFISNEISELQNNLFFKNTNFATAFSFNCTFEDQHIKQIYLLWNAQILDTDYETFKKAFSGELINKPLNVKWLLKDKGKNPGIIPLTYFLNSDLFIQEKNKSKLVDKIKMVFSDKEGNQFTRKQINNGISNYINSCKKNVQHRKWNSFIDERINPIRKLIVEAKQNLP